MSFNMSRVKLALPPLFIIALIGIGIYVQVSANKLSLPISTATNVFVILLPLFAAASVIYTPILSRANTTPNIQQILLPALHIIQGGIAIIIATLAAQGFLPGTTFNCAVDSRWQSLWHNHERSSIQDIQDSFNCCGYHSLKDRAWPNDCASVLKRHQSCDAPWHAASKRASGLQFAVAVIAGVLQLAHLAYLRRRAVRDNVNRNKKYRPGYIEEHNGEASAEEPYHDSEDEEDIAEQDIPRQALPSAQENAASRIQPSHLGHDTTNEWRSQ